MTSWLGVSLVVVAIGQPAVEFDATGIDAFRAVFCPMAAGSSPDSPRAHRYIARFNRDVADFVESFDFDRGLLDLTGPVPPLGIADRSQKVRKTYAESGKYSWLSWLGSGSSEAIGAFALAWALPGSKHFGDQRLRRGAVRGIEAFLEHQAPSGEFVFCSIRFSSVYGSHEMAWRLEPLLAEGTIRLGESAVRGPSLACASCWVCHPRRALLRRPI